MNFKEAAYHVLGKEKKPLSTKEITDHPGLRCPRWDYGGPTKRKTRANQ